MKPTVLVVDDDGPYRAMIGRTLTRRNFLVESADSGEIALDRIGAERFDVVLTDVVMPGIDGLELLKRIRQSAPDLPVVVTSGTASLDIALRAIREGAHDFLEKPAPDDRLAVTLENAIRYGRLDRRNRELEADRTDQSELVGTSAAMEGLRKLIRKVAPSDGRALILGENGTGKELVAAAIHRGSSRASGPFVKLNCAAVPHDLVESELFGHERGAFTGAVQARRGRFEQAEGGTLFLDEIGDMPPAMQSKLLRVLQEGRFERVGGGRTIEVDVRVIAATHRDLGAMVDSGAFREDLYYRLNVVTLPVPPLRERREDVPLLATRFLSEIAPRLSFAPDALALLAEHDWPGNVRELRNLVERVAILAEDDTIGRDDLAAQLRGARRARAPRAITDDSAPPATPTTTPSAASSIATYRAGATLSKLLEEAEREIIRAALAHHGGNKAATARALDIDRSHFHKKLRGLGVE
jgi:two-component system nitrogen regulation response regulator NtrX